MNKDIANNKQRITLTTVVYHDPEMVSAPMDDELVMFSLEHGMYYGLDNIASVIWQRIEQPTSVEDLCNSLLDEFDVDRDTCQRETLELLNWLFTQDLVKIDSSSN